MPREIAELNERLESFAERVSNAEQAAREAIERTHKLEMQLEAVRDERDEARQELKEWLRGHPPSVCSRHQVLDLQCEICNFALYQRNQAQAACAEMREVLGMVAEVATPKVQHALSTQAGKDWLSPSAHKAKLEELRQRLVAVCVEFS